jgi:short-subunit dehydrogenase
VSTSFQQQYGPWALIAGGSEGIGLSFARQLAKAGLNLILLARNATALNDAADELRAAHPVDIDAHPFDLTAENLEARLAAVCGDRDIGLLVYNAGAMHGADLFLDTPLASARQLIRLNCDGPVTLCHQLAGPMRARGRGGIILMSSMSGLAGGAYIAAYAASKSFDITLAEGLWAELAPFGVHVLGLIAGATDTPAMGRSGVRFTRAPMTADAVAAEGLAHLSAGPLHVAGDDNRAFAAILRGERNNAIETMSAGAASLYLRPYPLEAEAPGDG